MHKRIFYFISISLSVMMLASGCKIQNAPGAYAVAYGKVPVENVKEEESREILEFPTPESVVRESEGDGADFKAEEHNGQPVVETPAQPEPQQPVVEEKEVAAPREECFEVVEGQSNVELKTYHVVIGSFGKHQNAINLQADMRPHYQPVIVVNERGMYRVLLISYDTYDEAKNKIKEIRHDFPDAWVLIQKK